MGVTSLPAEHVDGPWDELLRVVSALNHDFHYVRISMTKQTDLKSAKAPLKGVGGILR